MGISFLRGSKHMLRPKLSRRSKCLYQSTSRVATRILPLEWWKASDLLSPSASQASIFEDGTDDPALLAKKIEAIKRMLAADGIDVFINARTDIYLQDLVTDDQKVAETLKRAAMYQDAGADGLFVPGLIDSTDIVKITKGTGLPVNLMADAAPAKGGWISETQRATVECRHRSCKNHLRAHRSTCRTLSQGRR